jgi:hypothetical protein
MIILLFANILVKWLEPSNIWLLAAIEILLFDSVVLGSALHIALE